MSFTPGPASLDAVPFAEAFDSLPDPVVVVDRTGAITAVNHLAVDLFGYPREELVGEQIEVLVPDEPRRRHEAHREGYLAAPASRPMGVGLDLAARRKDGTTIAVDISLSPLQLGDDRVVLVAVRDMTTQRDAEEALAAFAFIVESSDDLICQVDPLGRILTWNPGAVRVTGYDEAEVVGGPADRFVPVHRRHEVSDVLFRALSGERTERQETELERSDGQLVPVELTTSPLRDRSGRIVGASVIAHDITEQRLAQEFLAESEQRLREAQELASVGMWSWDQRADVVQYSEPLYRILGVDPTRFGGTFDDLAATISDDERDRVVRALQEALDEARGVDLECSIDAGDGSTRWVSIRADAVPGPDGAVAGLRGIVQDLTVRHQAETAVRAALEREREAARQLREADRLKDEFLSIVSHELRTPLTAIIGLSGILVESATSDDLRSDLTARVRRNAEEMRGMVERLLDFSRLEAGRVVLRLEPTKLAEVVHAAREQADGLLDGYQLEVDVPDDLVLVADPDALERVLVNLLTNAAKFSPAGSSIRVSAAFEGGEMVMRVRDQGRGVDRNVAGQLFERFFQVKEDQPAGRRGAGVGLAIVQRYVELHGGRVWVDSERGEGATFSIALPSTRSAP